MSDKTDDQSDVLNKAFARRASDSEYVSPIDEKYIPVDEHIEYTSENGEQIKGIYLLPNLLTTAAMFCGFYAILSAIGDKFEPAVIALLFAMLFDGLDGRVARLMNAQSEFGKEYDSLSDMLSFGVAPGIIAYKFGLMHLGKLGWAIAFLYTACAALRLARFNTQVGESPSKFFSGLASPAAAAFLISYIWTIDDLQIVLTRADEPFLLAMLAIIATLAGLLIISNLSYYSFKDLNMKGRVSFVSLLAFIMLLAFITIDPPLFLFLITAGYVVLGVLYTLYTRMKKT